MKNLVKIAFSGMLLSSSLFAHSFWINSFESFSHKPGHILVGLGWGHSLPIDDILNSPSAKIDVEEFKIFSPDGKAVSLKIPTNKVEEAISKVKNFEVFNADLALHKIALKDDSQEGLYTIEAKTKESFFTQYIDTKGNTRLKLTTMDKLTDVKEMIMSMSYQGFARSYVSLGKWEEPKATNKGLEIIPKTDLSKLKVGDLVEFEVLFEGKPLTMKPSSFEYITAFSKGFGQDDEFSLISYIKEGKAKFRVQNSGQWLVNCYHKEEVTKDGVLKHLYGKSQFQLSAGSLTFDVK